MIREHGVTVETQKDMSVLDGLAPDMPLARVIPSAGHWRINVTWRKSSIGRYKTKMHTTAIPILVEAASGSEFPVVRHIDSDPDSDRNAVVTRPPGEKINPEPFLPRYRIYRYRAEAAAEILSDPDWKEHLATMRKRSLTR